MGNRNPDGGFSCGNARPEVQADGGAGTYCKPPLQKKVLNLCITAVHYAMVKRAVFPTRLFVSHTVSLY